MSCFVLPSLPIKGGGRASRQLDSLRNICYRFGYRSAKQCKEIFYADHGWHAGA